MIEINSYKFENEKYETKLDGQIQSNWTEQLESNVSYIKNKPLLEKVATSGDYNDLTNKLTAGENIKIDVNNVISAIGGSKVTNEMFAVELDPILFNTEIGWKETIVSETSDFVSIAKNKDVLIAVGKIGAIYRSHDNGLNWYKIENSLNEHIKSVASDGLNVFIIITDNNVIKSNDNGLTWSGVIIPDSVGNFNFIYFGRDEFILLNNNGEIYTGASRGETWTKTSPSEETTDWKHGCYRDGVYLAVGLDTLYKSNTNGTNWVSIGNILGDLQYCCQTNVFFVAVGLAGALVKVNRISGTLHKENIFNVNFKSVTSVNNNIIAIGDYGYVGLNIDSETNNNWLSVDIGQSDVEVFNYIFTTNEESKYVYIIGEHIYLSVDSGNTWKKVSEFTHTQGTISLKQALYSYGKFISVGSVIPTGTRNTQNGLILTYKLENLTTEIPVEGMLSKYFCIADFILFDVFETAKIENLEKKKIKSIETLDGKIRIVTFGDIPNVPLILRLTKLFDFIEGQESNCILIS